MTDQELQQRWPELKQKLMAKYPQLTEDELVAEIGKEGETLRRLEKKLDANWDEWKNLLSIMG